jgi:hypothetical protein
MKQRAVELGVCLTSVLLIAGAATASDSAEYIQTPDWARQPSASELDLYRPIDAPTPGRAVVDCTAKADGHLIDCRAVEAQPMGVNYEFAGPRAVERCFKLKPTLADGRSVAGMHVLVTVIWKSS